MKTLRLLLLFGLACPVFAEVDTVALPDVEEGFEINFFVKEPHIINPSSLCFDKRGRLYVGAGPQYRNPKEDSPTDYIKILIDDDNDGVAETVKTFAEGFNCVQAMAWKNDELWVANAPELTVLRDTDGDDVADEYQIIYTGLNNLRHSVHGLNWGPDGWLYFSMGNTWVKPNAPKPIRDLQGIKSDDKTEYPLTKVYTKDTYPKSYHPMNKRETEGGIFRCRPGGHDLELYARGMRNPWDICMDSGFNWLGTDNDPGAPGERIFMPIRHGHYSMRHPWKFDWMGRHIAIAPSSDLFPGVSGSGTGVAFYHSRHFPKKYRGCYLIADWTNNSIFLYEPKWDGALQVPAVTKRKIVDGGVTQAGDLGYKAAKGRALFRPTDIEVGPDGALYAAGWGSVYGTKYVPKEKWTPEENAKYQGRVFRLRHKDPLIPRSSWDTPKRRKDIETWTFDQLIEDIGHQVHVWRVNAQDEMIRRGPAVRKDLLKTILSGSLTENQATWSIWALGHIDKVRGDDYSDLKDFARGKQLNLRIQATRILGENRVTDAAPLLIELLGDPEPRIRAAAMQSLDRIGWGEQSTAILDKIADETDRIALYTDWQVMRRQLSAEARRTLLEDERFGIRRMAALGLMEEGDRALQRRAKEFLEESGAKPKLDPIAAQPSTPRVAVMLQASEPHFRESTTISFQIKGSGYLPAKKNHPQTGQPLQVDIGRDNQAKLQSGWSEWNFSGSGGIKNASKSFAYAHAMNGKLNATLTTTTSAEARHYGLDKITDPANLGIPDVWRDQMFFNNNTSGSMTLLLENLKAGTYRFTSYSYANNLSAKSADEGTAHIYVNGVKTPMIATFVTGGQSKIAGSTIESADLHSYGTVSFPFTVAEDGASIAISYQELTSGDTFGLNGFEVVAVSAPDADPAKAFDLRYTVDGSGPNATSAKATGPIKISKNATIKAGAFSGNQLVSDIESLTIKKITDSEWRDRLFVLNVSPNHQVINDGLQRGVTAYGDDQGETITDVPEALAGSIQIRTRKEDRENQNADFLSFEVNLPATVHLAYDPTAKIPNWLEKDFKKTEQVISTSKGRKLRVYSREAKAGTVLLGGNGGANAMYQIYVSRAGLKKTTMVAVQTALKKANPKHGEEIFFGRGTCFACHHVKGRGVVVGPDLQGIGKRRDLNYVIESTLNPDAYIVEGFQQTSLDMKDGRTLFGMIQEETGQGIKLVLPTGESVEVNTGDVKKRADAKNSLMPASFAYTLSPQDVADVSAWIMTLAPATKTANVPAVKHVPDESKVVVSIEGKVFTEYRYGNKGKPILYPIIGPHGISMTRNYPMKAGVSGEANDHPHHQSMHYNHPVNGHDFWHGRSGEHIRTDQILKAETTGGQALIVSENSWVKGDKVVCTDTTEIRGGVTEGGRFIDFKISIHASHGEVTFEDSKEGSMSIRTHPALRLTGRVAKGSAVNSAGDSGKAVWGKAAQWVDYWGPIGDKTVGIAIFDHPDNPRHPTTWHARDYGLITANPFGKRSFKAGEGALTVKKGETVTFAYRFFFHEGGHKHAAIPKHFEKWGASFSQKAMFK